MKRWMKMLLCLAVLSALLPGACAAEEGGWRLVEISLWPEEAEDRGYCSIGVSPDGEGVLWKDVEEGCLYVTRNGSVRPFVKAEGRGAEDPYGRLDVFLHCAAYLPGVQGVSWTPDGRYAVMDLLQEFYTKFIPYDPVILDTWTGEAFLAAAYPGVNILDEGPFATVHQARFSSDGRYLYYNMISFPESVGGEGRQYRWIRCDMETGAAETLLSIPMADWGNYQNMPGLFETPGGGLITVIGETHFLETLTRREGGQWQRRLTPLKGNTWWPNGQMNASPLSGWGLVQRDFSATVNGYTLLQMTGNGVKELYSWGFCQEFLEETQTLSDIRIAQIQFGGKYPQFKAPEGSSGPMLGVSSRLCLSPDGGKALVYLHPWMPFGVREIRLLDLASMTMAPVAVPEDAFGDALEDPTGKVFFFYPGITWEQNDTVLMLCGDTVKAFRLERGED